MAFVEGDGLALAFLCYIFCSIFWSFTFIFSSFIIYIKSKSYIVNLIDEVGVKEQANSMILWRKSRSFAALIGFFACEFSVVLLLQLRINQEWEVMEITALEKEQVLTDTSEWMDAFPRKEGRRQHLLWFGPLIYIRKNEQNAEQETKAAQMKSFDMVGNADVGDSIHRRLESRAEEEVL